MNDAQNLLKDLMAWRDGQNLRPLLQRAIELVGPEIVLDLPFDGHLAREKLIDAVEGLFEDGAE